MEQKQQAIQLIKIAITNDRLQVIKSLKDSDVIIPTDLNNTELLDLILKELKNNNGYLIYNLGEIITPLIQTQNYSNIAPLIVGGIISVGSKLLGGLLGGGGSDNSYNQYQASQLQSQQQAANQAALKKQMIIAASNAKAEKIKAETASKKQKAKTTRTAIIISSIGLVAIAGTIITIKLLKNKN